MGWPSTRVERGKKVTVGPKLSHTKASNAHRASKAGMIVAEVNRVLAETMVTEGDNSVCTLRHRMRQLDGLQYALAGSGLTPPTLWRSLHMKLAEKKRSLMNAKLAEKKRSLLLRPQDVVGSKVEKRGSSSSSYEEMVTATMNEPSLPFSKEEALLQRFQNMSLEKSSNVDDRKAVDEVDRVLGEAMVVKEGDDLVSSFYSA